MDLNQLTSPYQGSTANTPNNYALSCGGYGNEQRFFAVLQPGEMIVIGQTSNTFDSRHELAVGGAYPGDSIVACRDDPDNSMESYTNNGNSAVNLYFTIDAYTTGSGDYTLEWTVTGIIFAS